jgi:hypothetical protein
MTPPSTKPLYSFGLLSDIHLMGNSNGGTATDDGNGFGRYPNGTKFHKILTFFENQGASFCCVSGDLTNIGFWKSANDTTVYTDQFAEYKQIRELHPNLPVYGLCGNHESYYKNITETLTELEEYSGHGLNYTITRGNDLFIMIGQNTPSTPMTDEALSWLETTLETNKNKRCFVFVHSVVDDNDSGTRFGYYHNMTFDWWGAKKTTFINMMQKYKNAMLFHGHTHVSFEAQTMVSNVIYSTALGFKSIHVPATAYVRMFDTVNQKFKEAESAEGYIVDVYDNYIVLNGYSFAKPDYNTSPAFSGTSWNETPAIVPTGQYRIDTTLQTIEANTFTDSTGTIAT